MTYECDGITTMLECLGSRSAWAASGNNRLTGWVTCSSAKASIMTWQYLELKSLAQRVRAPTISDRAPLEIIQRQRRLGGFAHDASSRVVGSGRRGAFVWSDNLSALAERHVPFAWEWLAVIAGSHFNWLQLTERLAQSWNHLLNSDSGGGERRRVRVVNAWHNSSPSFLGKWVSVSHGGEAALPELLFRRLWIQKCLNCKTTNRLPQKFPPCIHSFI